MRNKSNEATLGCLLVLLTMPLSAIWRGYVLCVLWSWFVVSWFNLRPLSIPVAIGLGMIVSFLTMKRDEAKSDESKDMSERLIEAVLWTLLYPAFALLFGWIVHLFM